MKAVLSALALATFAVGAQSQVTLVGGTDRSVFPNYNPNGAAQTLGPLIGFRDAMINTTDGLLTATFIGFEALHTNTFTFAQSSGTLSSQGALNASISGTVSAGALNFTFTDLFRDRRSGMVSTWATSPPMPFSARSRAACSHHSPWVARMTSSSDSTTE